MGFRLSGGGTSLPYIRNSFLAATTSEIEMSAYLRTLQKEQLRTQRAPPATLQQRIQAWFNALPELTRHRPFSMQELETALRSQGRHLGPALASLAWNRMRTYGGNQPYRRYWLPPGFSK